MFKPREADPHLFRANVHKSWVIIGELVGRIEGECLIRHSEAPEGVGYDNLVLSVRDNGQTTSKSFSMNRNGANSTALRQIWEEFDRLGRTEIALQIIDACEFELSAVPQDSSAVWLCDQVLAWIAEHRDRNFYVGPVRWKGSCTELLNLPSDDDQARQRSREDPWMSDISCGIDGREVLRLRPSERLVFTRDANNESTVSVPPSVDERKKSVFVGGTDQEDTQLDASRERYFAYVYRDPRTLEVLYAGYGTHPGRAYSVGHNRKVAAVVESGDGFEILIAGPYRDESEARNIESALVSATSPNLNLIQQPGLKFRHLGVPNSLGIRRTEVPLTIHETGRIVGGALIVYCNLTTQLKSGHQKLSPTNFDDEVILRNIRDHWKVKKFLPEWIRDPQSSPRTLIAVQGPIGDRIIVASCSIDLDGWKDTPTAPWDPHVHRVPLRVDEGLDVGGIRGRRIAVKFGSGPPNYIMWIDGTGLVRHGYRVKGTVG